LAAVEEKITVSKISTHVNNAKCPQRLYVGYLQNHCHLPRGLLIRTIIPTAYSLPVA